MRWLYACSYFRILFYALSHSNSNRGLDDKRIFNSIWRIFSIRICKMDRANMTNEKEKEMRKQFMDWWTDSDIESYVGTQAALWSAWQAAYQSREEEVQRLKAATDLIEELEKEIAKMQATEPTEKLGFFRYKMPNRADCGFIAEQVLEKIKAFTDGANKIT
jgi:hypothetical protein